MKKVYVGLGGNIGDTASVLRKALKHIADLPGVKALTVSQLYETSPVSAQSQSFFINAICTFMTTMSSFELLQALQNIEKELGKQVKEKDQPRIIDLDLLFYGEEYHNSAELQLPHPRWSERLFVLVPLLELTFSVCVPDAQGSSYVDLCELAKEFKNIHNETVRLIHA